MENRNYSCTYNINLFMEYNGISEKCEIENNFRFSSIESAHSSSTPSSILLIPLFNQKSNLQEAPLQTFEERGARIHFQPANYKISAGNK